MEKPKRTKANAAANEVLDVERIITAIHTKSPTGIKIAAAFHSKFGYEILDARQRAGSSRGTHNDFEILVNEPDGPVWRRCEHKGGKEYKVIGPNDKPWKSGVQFHNGGCDKYSITKKYARAWYDIHVGSGTLKAEFGIEASIPSYEDWYKHDCCVQADPKTEFGKELKRRVRELHGPKASLLDKRAAVHAALEIGEDDMRTFMEEVLPIMKEALEQKDYWLAIQGDLGGEFHMAWYPKFTVFAIKDCSVKKGKDIHFDLQCSDDIVLHPILRWGKGAGFSCLRIDLK